MKITYEVGDKVTFFWDVDWARNGVPAKVVDTTGDPADYVVKIKKAFRAPWDRDGIWYAQKDDATIENGMIVPRD